MLRWLLIFLTLFAAPAHAMELEEGSDAPTRTIQDYIKDYVDIPKGAMDWKTFGKTEMINIESNDKDGLELQYYKPGFSDDLKKLDGKTVKIKGFMFPLDESDEQGQFLFGPFPLNCPFQYHVQPNLVIEVDAKANPIPFSYDPITLSGILKLVPSDPENSTFYRLLGAKTAR